jgi:hypothetical protein
VWRYDGEYVSSVSTKWWECLRHCLPPSGCPFVMLLCSMMAFAAIVTIFFSLWSSHCDDGHHHHHLQHSVSLFSDDSFASSSWSATWTALSLKYNESYDSKDKQTIDEFDYFGEAKVNYREKVWPLLWRQSAKLVQRWYYHRE